MFVLHRQPLGEHDQLLSVLSRESGRLFLVTPRRCSLSLVLHACFQADWQQGIDWPRIAAVSCLESHHLKGDHLLCGLYVNELLHRLLPLNDAAPAVFIQYQTVIRALADQHQPEPWLRILEYQLLQSIGYGFSWQQDHNERPLKPECYYDFVPGSGFIPSATGAFAGQSLLALSGTEQPDIHSWRCAKQILRAAIDQLLDRPLISRQFFAYGSAS